MRRDDEYLAAICRTPEDDTVRLAYADYLAANGQDERAEFIRVQIALAKLDPPPYRLGYGPAGQPDDREIYDMRAVGRNYWTFRTSELDADVGDRVDVRYIHPLRANDRLRVRYGLLVTRRIRGDFGGDLFVVKRDGKSSRWAGWAYLAREKELLHNYGRAWCAPLSERNIGFTRGFIGNLALSWADWLALQRSEGAHRSWPITRVTLTTLPAVIFGRQPRYPRNFLRLHGCKTYHHVPSPQTEKVEEYLLAREWPRIHWDLSSVRALSVEEEDDRGEDEEDTDVP